MSKFTSILLIFLLFSVSVNAATIYGTIYDSNSDPATGVYVEVDSEPIQRHISKFGGYSFDLKRGNYTLSVYLPINKTNLLLAQQNVTIKSDGNFIVDIYSNEKLIPKKEINNSFNYLWVLLFSIILILLLILAIVFVLSRFNKKDEFKKINFNEKKDFNEDEKLEEEIRIETSDDVVKKRILKLMFENEGKITQKEIRKKISLSEAKISQLLRDLESEKKIKKVKQGRINIILKV